jgi:hypothetical protein
MEAKIEKEHQWLQQLVGEWTFEHEAVMGEGKEPMKMTGAESVRSVGGVWIIAEGQWAMPGGGDNTMILTLGYDPDQKKFVGTWLGSMMTYLWVYEGQLDAARNVLTLDTVGPNMEPGGSGMAQFKERIEIKADGTRLFSSSMLGSDGKWNQFMSGTYRRRH